MAQLDGKRSRWYLASAAVGGIFLFFTHSRTALIATILGLGVTFLLRGSRTSKKIVLSAALISGLCALMLLGAGLLPSVKNALSSERDGDFSVGTFSGRTEIWQDVEPYILARPLIGHGYLSFWTPAHIAEISDLEQWGVPDSHSAYIDYLLTLGAVGLTLYLLCLGQGLRKAFQLSRSYRNNEAGFMGAIVVFGLVDGFFESSIGEGSMLMFLCIIALTWIAFAAEDTPPSALLNREPGAEPDRTAHV
jgi:O-antigen ligase